MATPFATKRLTKEYQNIHKNPPPYIIAHPTEENILEWHYIITGPPDTPYKGGQYWGTLLFPADYPFAPPAIRMYTPSGRFQPGVRLCLSISDFHPKSFNPAWEVSTILNGLLSFMTGDEMTTGSVHESDESRRAHAARSRWWNSTGNGTATSLSTSAPQSAAQPAKRIGMDTVQAIQQGDGGERFRREFPDIHTENLKFIAKASQRPKLAAGSSPAGVRRRTGPGAVAGAGAGEKSGETELSVRQSWVSQHKYLVGVVVFVGYVLATRILGPGMVHHAGTA